MLFLPATLPFAVAILFPPFEVDDVADLGRVRDDSTAIVCCLLRGAEVADPAVPLTVRDAAEGLLDHPTA